jgi:CHAD domain-containing protein
MTSPLQDIESLQQSYRRLAVDCIAKAIAALDEERGRDVAIHTIRKQCKQARALIRLFNASPPSARRHACRFFRDVGRSLSSARDARVALDVHALLLERFGGVLEPAGVARVREQLESHLQAKRGGADGQSIGGPVLRRQLLAARVSARRAVIAATGEEALKAGFLRAYRRARRAAQIAADSGQPADFHEARKCAKDYWYQLEFVARRWPGITAARIAAARRLTELLGDAQDCEAYAAVISSVCGKRGAATTEVLLALAEHRARSLRQEALLLCAEVFAEKPKELATSIDAPEPGGSLNVAAG